MSHFRAEVLGRVPNGLTHNDVFASFDSMMKEVDSQALTTKRRLSGNMISLIVSFESKDVNTASVAVIDSARGISGFAFDVIIRERPE